ncbi:MAG: DUF4292 domain-containing protein [Chitinophagales bacterium]
MLPCCVKGSGCSEAAGNMIFGRFSVGIGLALLLLASCKVRHKENKPPDVVPIESRMAREVAPFLEQPVIAPTFSAKMKIDYNGDQGALSFNGTIRMKKDSAIWLSFTGPFGIEGARAMITRDSFFLNNKLNGEKIRQDLKYMSRYLPLPANFNMLQRYVYGYLLPLPFTRFESDTVARLAQAVADQATYRYAARVDAGNYTVQNSVLTDKLDGRELQTTFEALQEVEALMFPGSRKIVVKQGNRQQQLQIEFSKVKLNQPVAFPFE